MKEIFEKAFSEVRFDEESHSYYVEDKLDVFISVTSLIDLYSHEFESDTISKKTALKKGISQEELLEKWEAKRNASVEKGNYIHDFIENRIKLENYQDDTNFYSKERLQFLDFEKDFLKDKLIIYSEKVLYDCNYLLAGTIDCLAYDELNKKLFYIDWKTNEKISFFNKYKNFKFPLNKYQQCSKEVYSLQLSFYRFIIETEVIDKNKSLSFLKDNSVNYVVQFNQFNDTYNVLELPYYKYSVIQTLKHYKKGK